MDDNYQIVRRLSGKEGEEWHPVGSLSLGRQLGQLPGTNIDITYYKIKETLEYITTRLNAPTVTM